MARIRLACADDVRFMSPRLRKGDIEEIYASTGKPYQQAFEESYAGSTWAKVALDDQDLPVAMFGLWVHNRFIGVPWMLVTEDFLSIVKPFRRQCRGVVEDMQDQCPTLMNAVMATNTTAQRWLRWCGFTINPRAIPYGPFGTPFYPFSRTRDVRTN